MNDKVDVDSQVKAIHEENKALKLRLKLVEAENQELKRKLFSKFGNRAKFNGA